MDEPKTYRKQPLDVEAIQWKGDNREAVDQFCGTDLIHGRRLSVLRVDDQGLAELWVAANQKFLEIEPGEWILKDELGFYPCKDIKFRESYLEVLELPEQTLATELSSVLNRYSAENDSGTPDFILARYLISCLNAFNMTIQARAAWRAEPVELPALQVDP